MSEIPQSTALAEAQVDSLGELFSRNPEDLDDAGLDRIIAEMRAQRAKQAKADTEPKATKPKAGAKLVSTVPIGELDL